MNIARGDISRAGIINPSLALLRALLECGYYSREGLIWGNTVDAPNTEEGSSDTQTDKNEVQE